jgi:signal peptidase I
MIACVLRGGSMRPFLRPGALLVLTPVALERLRPGSVLVYRQAPPGTGLVAHRVVTVKHFPEGVSVRTQGDSAPHRDPPLRQERVLGRVAAYWQNGRLCRTTRATDTAAAVAVQALRGLRRVAAMYRLAHRIGAALMRAMLKTKPGVVFRREGDEALLFDPQSGEVKLLNETGATAWEMLAAGAQTTEIVDRLMHDFDQKERAVVARDVERFIGSMRGAGIVAQ